MPLECALLLGFASLVFHPGEGSAVDMGRSEVFGVEGVVLQYLLRGMLSYRDC